MASYTQYKRIMSALDANDDNIETWITVKGNHIPIMKGQSKEEAVKAFIEKKGGKSSGGKSETNAGGNWKKSPYGSNWQREDGNTITKISATKAGYYDKKKWDATTGKQIGEAERFNTKEEAMGESQSKMKKAITKVGAAVNERLYDEPTAIKNASKELGLSEKETKQLSKFFTGKSGGEKPTEKESDKDFIKRKLGEWKEKDSVAKSRTELGKAWRNGEISDKEFIAKSNGVTERELSKPESKPESKKETSISKAFNDFSSASLSENRDDWDNKRKALENELKKEYKVEKMDSWNSRQGGIMFGGSTYGLSGRNATLTVSKNLKDLVLSLPEDKQRKLVDYIDIDPQQFSRQDIDRNEFVKALQSATEKDGKVKINIKTTTQNFMDD